MSLWGALTDDLWHLLTQAVISRGYLYPMVALDHWQMHPLRLAFSLLPLVSLVKSSFLHPDLCPSPSPTSPNRSRCLVPTMKPSPSLVTWDAELHTSVVQTAATRYEALSASPVVVLLATPIRSILPEPLLMQYHPLLFGEQGNSLLWLFHGK